MDTIGYSFDSKSPTKLKRWEKIRKLLQDERQHKLLRDSKKLTIEEQLKGVKAPQSQGKYADTGGYSQDTKQKKIKSETDAFEKQIDDWQNRKLQTHKEITVGSTPDVLINLGAQQLPITIKQDVLKKVVYPEAKGGKHGIPIKLLKQIPQQIHNPIMVFDSATQKNSLVLMTELIHNGKTIVVAIHLSKKEGRHVVNDIASIHPREHDSHFVNWIKKGLLRYMNKQKSLKWFQSRGLQLPKEGIPIQGLSDKSLSQQDKSVNEQSTQKEPWQMTLQEYRRKYATKTVSPITSKSTIRDVVFDFTDETDNFKNEIMADRNFFAWVEGEKVFARYEGYGTISDVLEKLDEIRVAIGESDWFEHRESVGKAISQNKPVPPEVLKDYPDLQPKSKKPPHNADMGGYSQEQDLLSKPDVPIIHITGNEISTTQKIWEFRNVIKNYAKRFLGKEYLNNDTKWNLKVSGDSVDKLSGGGVKLTDMQSVVVLPDLIKNAVLAESYPDRYGDYRIKFIHRFYAPLAIRDTLFRVKLTVKEYTDEKIGKKFYSLETIQLETPTVNAHALEGNSPSSRGRPIGVSKISITDLLKDATKNDGSKFVTPEKKSSPPKNADTGGYAQDNPPIWELPEIVEIAERINNGEFPEVKRYLENAMGRFSPGKGKISLRADIAIGERISERSVSRKKADEAFEEFQETVKEESQLPENMLVFRKEYNRKTGKVDLIAYRKDPTLANKVLAHELFHLIDHLPESAKRGNILGHIASLKKYLKSMIDEIPTEPSRIITGKERGKIAQAAAQFAKSKYPANAEKRKELYQETYKKFIQREIERRGLITREEILAELKALTQKWKPFDEQADERYTKYRYLNEELYADAGSVLLNNPKLLKEVAPKYYKSFLAYMKRKPEVKGVYDEILGRMKDKGKIIQHRIDLDYQAFQRGREERKAMDERNKIEPESVADTILTHLIDQNHANLKQIRKLEHGEHEAIARQARFDLEEMQYIDSEIENYIHEFDAKITKLMKQYDITIDDVGIYAKTKRIIKERGKLGIFNPRGETVEYAREKMKGLVVSILVLMELPRFLLISIFLKTLHTSVFLFSIFTCKT
ncbi:MAG: hypothetical protein HUU08_17150 [Candidatus Brocadia sp.]|nr:hypothetical protein [Candidatus Brocadia sp.]UJS16175.1 MAG: hypothetical protein L3J17_09610 [Candidatus Jettenia sp.]